MTAPAIAPAHARRRLAGCRAHNNAAAFELWVSRHIFAPMVTRGHLVRADKTDAHMRAIGDQERGIVFIPTEPGGADFVLLGADGRYIAIECRTVFDSRLYRDEIQPHQIKHLDDAARFGGAHLACQFCDGTRSAAYLIPWRDVPWATPELSPSIAAADVEKWRVTGWIDAWGILRQR